MEKINPNHESLNELYSLGLLSKTEWIEERIRLEILNDYQLVADLTGFGSGLWKISVELNEPLAFLGYQDRVWIKIWFWATDSYDMQRLLPYPFSIELFAIPNPTQPIFTPEIRSNLVKWLTNILTTMGFIAQKRVKANEPSTLDELRRMQNQLDHTLLEIVQPNDPGPGENL